MSYSQSIRGFVNSQNLQVDLSGSPPKLVEVIHTLLGKMKILIGFLEESANKIDVLENKATFWEDRYYSFKDQCIKNADKSTVEHLEKISQLEQEVKRLTHNLYFTNSTLVRSSFTQGIDRTGLKTETFTANNWSYEKPRISDLDRLSEENVRTIGPKSIGRFKFARSASKVQQ